MDIEQIRATYESATVKQLREMARAIEDAGYMPRPIPRKKQDLVKFVRDGIQRYDDAQKHHAEVKRAKARRGEIDKAIGLPSKLDTAFGDDVTAGDGAKVMRSVIWTLANSFDRMTNAVEQLLRARAQLKRVVAVRALVGTSVDGLTVTHDDVDEELDMLDTILRGAGIGSDGAVPLWSDTAKYTLDALRKNGWTVAATPPNSEGE